MRPIWKVIRQTHIRKMPLPIYVMICFLTLLSFGIRPSVARRRGDSVHFTNDLVHFPKYTDLAEPAGPYSYGVVVGNIYYLAGQSGRNPTDKSLVSGIEGQTRQALKNIGTVLSPVCLNYSNVVKVIQYLKNIEDLKIVNSVYKEFFQPPYPVRTTIQVAELPLKDNLIEIEAVAAIPEAARKRNCRADTYSSPAYHSRRH